jgi:hypothetical protein
MTTDVAKTTLIYIARFAFKTKHAPRLRANDLHIGIDRYSDAMSALPAKDAKAVNWWIVGHHATSNRVRSMAARAIRHSQLPRLRVLLAWFRTRDRKLAERLNPSTEQSAKLAATLLTAGRGRDVFDISKIPVQNSMKEVVSPSLDNRHLTPVFGRLMQLTTVPP